PNTEVSGVADIQALRLKRAESAAGAKGYPDYRGLLDDSSIDAVIIATPQHLRADQFCAAIEAGKHVYVEKTLALNLPQLKRMRAVYQRDNGHHVVQVGHQATSFGHMADVRQFLSQPERIGKLTAIAMQMHRNTPSNKPLWSRPALLTPELNAENTD